MTFILTFILHACMGWIFFKEMIPKISVFSSGLPNFPFAQFTFEYLIPCFPKQVSGKATANL